MLFRSASSEEEEEEEEEDPETTEQRRRIKLLAEETGDLERAIAVKEGELSKAPNPIFKVRSVFAPTLLVTDLLAVYRNASRR